MIKFTIFTPTYNRAYTLPALYQSLRNQTCMDFEWVIVDDGSTDNTETVCQGFKQDLFPISYFRQQNSGKHVAVNEGVKQAQGEWFFIVDSDDHLPVDAIEKLQIEERTIHSEKIGVLCGMKHYFNGKRICSNFPYDKIDCTALDFRYKYRVKGDVAEVVRTKVMKEFPFPQYPGERFCPEAILFNRIAQKYLTHYFNACIYLCKYLPDGLSAHIVKVRMQSWRSTCLCYAEMGKAPIPFDAKLRAWINYWRFSACRSKKESPLQITIPFFAKILRPLGLLFHLKDCRS